MAEPNRWGRGQMPEGWPEGFRRTAWLESALAGLSMFFAMGLTVLVWKVLGWDLPHPIVMVPMVYASGYWNGIWRKHGGS